MRASDEFRIALNEYLDTMVDNILDVENSYLFLRNKKIKTEVKNLLKPNINKLAENEVVALYAEFKKQDIDMNHRWDFFKKYVKREYIKEQINYYDICDAEEEKIKNNAITLLNNKYGDNLTAEQINVIVRDNQELSEGLYVGDLTLKEFLAIATHDYSAKLDAPKEDFNNSQDVYTYQEFETELKENLFQAIDGELQAPSARMLSEEAVNSYIKGFGPTLFKVFNKKTKSKGKYNNSYTIYNFVCEFYGPQYTIVRYFRKEIEHKAEAYTPQVATALTEKLANLLKSPTFKNDVTSSIRPAEVLDNIDIELKNNPNDYGFGEGYFEEKLNSGYSDFYFPGLIHLINAKTTPKNVEKEYNQAVSLAVDDILDQIK